MNTSHHLRVSAGLLTLCLWMSSRVTSAAEPSIRAVGTLEPTAVSADGSVVVGDNYNYLAQAHRWTPDGGPIPLGVLPGHNMSTAAGVSADGAVVVGYSFSFSDSETGSVQSPAAFRWTAEGGMVSLGDSLRATAVSGDGQTIVGSGHPGGPNYGRSFRWSAAGGLNWLNDLTEPFTHASGTSADGAVIVGGRATGSGTEAFRWTAQQGMVGLGAVPGPSHSFATDVSSDGSVVAGYVAGPTGQFNNRIASRWTADTGMVALGTLTGDEWSEAYGVSGDGSIVIGYSYDPAHGATAFAWDEANGMRSLSDLLAGLGVDMTGWDLRVASAISADGLTIVGTGQNASGPTGWIATIPEPASLPFLTVAGLLVARRRGNQVRRQVDPQERAVRAAGAGGAESGSAGGRWIRTPSGIIQQ